MNWFFFALITMLAWGAADLFYKKGAVETDRFSHLKTVIVVGVVMGLHAAFTLIFGDISYDFRNLFIYFPVSLMYISSMAVGYFGLRYLELSISSPIQNTSGAIVCILCLIFLGKTIEMPLAIAVAVICVAIFLLGVIEKKQSDNLKKQGDKKYRIGFIAFFMPIIYCIIDALGTFFDAFYLDDIETTPLIGVTEDTLESVANTSYELTFLIAAIVVSAYIDARMKAAKGKAPVAEKADTDRKPWVFRFIAAILETTGQFTYVYAMSSEAVVAAPMVAAYSIVALLLSAIFLKEKLTLKQYICIAAVMAGIIVLGVFDV